MSCVNTWFLNLVEEGTEHILGFSIYGIFLQRFNLLLEIYLLSELECCASVQPAIFSPKCVYAHTIAHPAKQSLAFRTNKFHWYFTVFRWFPLL